MNESAEIPSSWNLPFIEKIYEDYARDPRSVDPQWMKFFREAQNGEALETPRFGPSFEPPGIFQPRVTAPARGPELDEASIASLQNRVNQLVRHYRVRGHNIAAL